MDLNTLVTKNLDLAITNGALNAPCGVEGGLNKFELPTRLLNYRDYSESTFPLFNRTYANAPVMNLKMVTIMDRDCVTNAVTPVCKLMGTITNGMATGAATISCGNNFMCTSCTPSGATCNPMAKTQFDMNIISIEMTPDTRRASINECLEKFKSKNSRNVYYEYLRSLGFDSMSDNASLATIIVDNALAAVTKTLEKQDKILSLSIDGNGQVSTIDSVVSGGRVKVNFGKLLNNEDVFYIRRPNPADLADPVKCKAHPCTQGRTFQLIAAVKLSSSYSNITNEVTLVPASYDGAVLSTLPALLAGDQIVASTGELVTLTGGNFLGAVGPKPYGYTNVPAAATTSFVALTQCCLSNAGIGDTWKLGSQLLNGVDPSTVFYNGICVGRFQDELIPTIYHCCDSTKRLDLRPEHIDIAIEKGSRVITAATEKGWFPIKPSLLLIAHSDTWRRLRAHWVNTTPGFTNLVTQVVAGSAPSYSSFNGANIMWKEYNGVKVEVVETDEVAKGSLWVRAENPFYNVVIDSMDSETEKTKRFQGAEKGKLKRVLPASYTNGRVFSEAELAMAEKAYIFSQADCNGVRVDTLDLTFVQVKSQLNILMGAETIFTGLDYGQFGDCVPQCVTPESCVVSC